MHPVTRKPRRPSPKPLDVVIEETAYHLANGTFAPSVLAGIDYQRVLSGDDLEPAMAVLINAVEFDADWNVTNPEAAKERAAQWIRQRCDPNYAVDPPLGDWETEDRTRPP